MAEFCVDCWNRINHLQKTEKDYILSKELDLCKGCGKFRHVIVRERMGFWSGFLNEYEKTADA